LVGTPVRECATVAHPDAESPILSITVTFAARRGILLLARDSAVKFHEHKTLGEEMKGQLPRHVTEEVFYATAMTGGGRTGNGLILAEGIWKRLRRPCYQVYPAIIPALLNLRRDIQTSLIHTPMPALLARLPADKPIDELPGVQTALMCQDQAGEDLCLRIHFMRPTGLANMHMTLGCEPGKTLEQSFQESAANTQSYIISGNFLSEQYMPLAPALRGWQFADSEGPVTKAWTQARWMSFSGRKGSGNSFQSRNEKQRRAARRIGQARA
jgi:hypothetical protein